MLIRKNACHNADLAGVMAVDTRAKLFNDNCFFTTRTTRQFHSDLIWMKIDLFMNTVCRAVSFYLSFMRFWLNC